MLIYPYFFKSPKRNIKEPNTGNLRTPEETEGKYSTFENLNIATPKREITLPEKHKGLSEENTVPPEDIGGSREHGDTESEKAYTRPRGKEIGKTEENKIEKYAFAHFVPIFRSFLEKPKK